MVFYFGKACPHFGQSDRIVAGHARVLAAQLLGLAVISGGMLLIVTGAVIALPLMAARLSQTAPGIAVVPVEAGGEE